MMNAAARRNNIAGLLFEGSFKTSSHRGENPGPGEDVEGELEPRPGTARVNETALAGKRCAQAGGWEQWERGNGTGASCLKIAGVNNLGSDRIIP